MDWLLIVCYSSPAVRLHYMYVDGNDCTYTTFFPATYDSSMQRTWGVTTLVSIPAPYLPESTATPAQRRSLFCRLYITGNTELRGLDLTSWGSIWP